jgi:hypothetical protein
MGNSVVAAWLIGPSGPASVGPIFLSQSFRHCNRIAGTIENVLNLRAAISIEKRQQPGIIFEQIAYLKSGVHAHVVGARPFLVRGIEIDNVRTAVIAGTKQL